MTTKNQCAALTGDPAPWEYCRKPAEFKYMTVFEGEPTSHGWACAEHLGQLIKFSCVAVGVDEVKVKTSGLDLPENALHAVQFEGGYLFGALVEHW